LISGKFQKRLIPHPLPVSVQQSAPSALTSPAPENRSRTGSRWGITFQFDVAEFARGARLDAVAKAHGLQRTPGLGLSALSSTRPGTVVPEAIATATTITRLLRSLTIIAAGSCRQAQPPGPFGRRARPTRVGHFGRVNQ